MGRPRKYKINEHFFEKWDKNMSYVLGYWFADGGMYHNPQKNNYAMSFTSKDKEHLVKILDLMDSDYPLRDKKDGSFAIQIGSKIMYRSLLELNGTDRKSLTANPPQLLNEHVYAFIRGYMDGDGWVSIKYSRNNYPTLGFIGTKEMMDMFISYLGSPNLYRQKYPERKTNTFIIHYYGEKAINILNILYENAFVFMQRKYDKYKEGLLWHNSRVSAEDKEEITKQYLNGLSLNEIAELFSITASTVSDVLKINRVKTRSISEALVLKHKRRKENYVNS